MEKKIKRKIVDEELSQEFLKTGCFMMRCSVEGYDVFKYRWDFVELIVDETWYGIRIKVNSFVENIVLSEIEGCKEEYRYETEEEFRDCILQIKRSFLDIVVPIVNKNVEEAIKNNRYLGNQETAQWITNEMDKFQNQFGDKGDEKVYQEILKIREIAYQLNKQWLSEWNAQQENKEILRQSIVMAMLASFLFGEWVIKTQGGYWKSQYPHRGYNMFVLVHPSNTKKMIDINEFLDKRCRRGSVHDTFSLEKDLNFWKNAK